MILFAFLLGCAVTTFILARNISCKSKPLPTVELKAGMVLVSDNGYTVTLTEVAEHWVRGTYTDGQRFMRSRKGFSKHFRPQTNK